MAPSLPCQARVVAAENTEAMTIGVNVLIEKSRRRISSTKKMPATGALKTEAMPAAAPQPTRVPACCCPIRRNLQSEELMAEPICTMGPSAPAEPPEPMVNAEASALSTATRGRMRPLCR